MDEGGGGLLFILLLEFEFIVKRLIPGLFERNLIKVNLVFFFYFFGNAAPDFQFAEVRPDLLDGRREIDQGRNARSSAELSVDGRIIHCRFHFFKNKTFFKLLVSLSRSLSPSLQKYKK